MLSVIQNRALKLSVFHSATELFILHYPLLGKQMWFLRNNNTTFTCVRNSIATFRFALPRVIDMYNLEIRKQCHNCLHQFKVCGLFINRGVYGKSFYLWQLIVDAMACSRWWTGTTGVCCRGQLLPAFQEKRRIRQGHFLNLMLFIILLMADGSIRE